MTGPWAELNYKFNTFEVEAEELAVKMQVRIDAGEKICPDGTP